MITRDNVQIGKIYVVQHARKGRFVAEVMAVIDADPDDEQDTFFVTMRLDVRRGTDQARLANAKEAVATKNIRPSLIISIVETDQTNWLRKAVAPASVNEQELQQKALGDAVLTAMRQIEQEKAAQIPPKQSLRERFKSRH